jgi:RNA polymerase sigma-70 factor (ECF subfamily)
VVTDGSDEEIIRGYLDGNPSAHRNVDRWIRPLVLSRHWGLRDDVDDILQEVRRRLYENLLHDRFQRGSSLKTYVSQMAKYVCIEFLRRRNRTRRSDLDLATIPDPSDDPERELDQVERRELARWGLSRLPEECRKLFDLIFVSELSYQDIAQRLGVAPGTVKSRAFRCREQLFRVIHKGGRRPEPESPDRH